MTNEKKPKADADEQLDAINHQVALDDAETATPTERDRKWSGELGLKIDARLAELRRNLTPADPPKERAKPLRASTLAMMRDALLAAIARITGGMGGTAQVQCRNLKELSDDDLRRLYDAIDPNNRTPE